MYIMKRCISSCSSTLSISNFWHWKKLFSISEKSGILSIQREELEEGDHWFVPLWPFVYYLIGALPHGRKTSVLDVESLTVVIKVKEGTHSIGKIS